MLCCRRVLTPDHPRASGKLIELEMLVEIPGDQSLISVPQAFPLILSPSVRRQVGQCPIDRHRKAALGSALRHNHTQILQP